MTEVKGWKGELNPVLTAGSYTAPPDITIHGPTEWASYTLAQVAPWYEHLLGDHQGHQGKP